MTLPHIIRGVCFVNISFQILDKYRGIMAVYIMQKKCVILIYSSVDDVMGNGAGHFMLGNHRNTSE
jgi:hypothetical protein